MHSHFVPHEIFRQIWTIKDSKQSLEIHGDIDIHWKTIIIALHERTHALTHARTHTHNVTSLGAMLFPCQIIHILAHVFISHEPLVDEQALRLKCHVILQHATFQLARKIYVIHLARMSYGEAVRSNYKLRTTLPNWLATQFWVAIQWLRNVWKCQQNVRSDTSTGGVRKTGKEQPSTLKSVDKCQQFNLIICLGIILANGFKVI